jgi:hypothetical protein
MQNPLAADQGETVPAGAPLRGAGRSVPCPPRRDAQRWKIPEADDGRAAPGTGLRWRRCGFAAGLQPAAECEQLFGLVFELQGDSRQPYTKYTITFHLARLFLSRDRLTRWVFLKFFTSKSGTHFLCDLGFKNPVF